MASWTEEPAARDPVPPGHGEPRSMEDPDWDRVPDPEEEDNDEE